MMNLAKQLTSCLVIALLVFSSGCVGIAPGITPVSDFDLERYLGKWYEIARLDHSFERGLENVTAEYSLRKDGGVKVLNKGYSSAKDKWDTAEGKAYFVSGENIGHLKVSFFGPIYGSYAIFELDEEHYQYSFVTSYNKSYLWLLARESTVEQSVIDKFLDLAKRHGYQTNELIFVKHN